MLFRVISLIICAIALQGCQREKVDERPFVVVDDMVTVEEDGEILVEPLANDHGEGLRLVSVSAPGQGAAVIEGERVRYRPAPDFFGRDSFTYTIEDQNGGRGSATIDITVVPINDLPEANGEQVVVEEDGQLELDVLANDRDRDGDPLAVVAVSNPLHGSAVILENGRLLYRSDPDFSGRDSFTYTIEDQNGGRGSATIDITVVPINDPPEVNGERAVVEENGQLELDVLANDRDRDGDPLTVVAVSAPLHGSVAILGGSRLRYIPSPGFDGNDAFTYTVADSAGAEGVATVEVIVEGQNDPPVAREDRIAMEEGAVLKLDLLANDLDPEARPLRVEVVTGPRRGELDATLSYTAPKGYNGYDELTYRVIDSEGATSAEVKVLLTIYEQLEPGAPIVQLPRTSLEAEELAVIVNDNDPVSVAIGPYYAQRRGIPEANIIHVSLPNDADVMSPESFAPVLEQVEKGLPEGIQGYVLTWIRPFRVGCMSITSAFALGGYAPQYCNTYGGLCSLTAAVDYFGSESTRPFDDHGIRPTMILGGVSEEEVKALIDRGIAADGSFPSGVGYLVRTTDSLRSVRYSDFVEVVSAWSHEGGLQLEYRDNADGKGSNLIENREDVLFYFTGLTWVEGIETNTYLPGAIADHLTSAGGILTATSGQMSVLRWLEAGATASYGAVVEPCNYPSKFPKVSTLLPFYFRGNTLLEAYWKSVQRPGEGVFVGEPLAKPWGRVFLRYADGDLRLRTTQLVPGKRYAILASDAPDGPFETAVGDITIDNHRLAEITIPSADRGIYRLVEQ